MVYTSVQGKRYKLRQLRILKYCLEIKQQLLKLIPRQLLHESFEVAIFQAAQTPTKSRLN